MKILTVTATARDVMFKVEAENEAEQALLDLSSGAVGSISGPTTTVIDKANETNEGKKSSVITLKLRSY